MTTPAGPARCDIPALHAAIAPPGELQRERRALYQLAVELLAGNCLHMLDNDVVDSPLARNRIGDALAGRAGLECATLVGIGALARMSDHMQALRVASRAEANVMLAGALDAVRAQLRQPAASAPPELLTEADGEQFTSALAVLRDGVALARSSSPELVDDLLPHVALVGVINPQRAGRLVSASPRTFPGLVLLRSPRSSIEVAEALVHEGAHQKLFDLAITHDLLDAGSDRCPPFRPPWAPKESRWPLEQILAACHAYACLARFAQDMGGSAASQMLGADSLLPVATERSKVLGEWLRDKDGFLGADAHTLLDGLLGRRPRAARPIRRRCRPVTADYVIDPALEFRRCGSPDRVLVGRPSQPPQLYWVSDDAATLLELLGRKSLEEAAHTFAHRWRVPEPEATDRLAVLLSDLYVSGLVKIRDTAGGSP